MRERTNEKAFSPKGHVDDRIIRTSATAQQLDMHGMAVHGAPPTSNPLVAKCILHPLPSPALVHVLHPRSPVSMVLVWYDFGLAVWVSTQTADPAVQSKLVNDLDLAVTLRGAGPGGADLVLLGNAGGAA